MKTIIHTHGFAELFEPYLADPEEYELSPEDIEQMNRFSEQTAFPVDTLDEYFTLLETLDSLANGEMSIVNCGKDICAFD